MKQDSSQQGSITTLTLVFGSIFLVVIGGLFGFILLQHKASLQRVSHQEALHLAEAGIDYYRWRLIHFPNDLQDGTGEEGPYEHSWQDATGEVQGTFSLDIEGTTQCGETTGAVITSTGWTEDFPEVQRTVRVTYSRPTVAEFAYLINDNVWAGPDREIQGPYHSNGGVRMDGENFSLVTSARETWICDDSFGCDEDGEEVDGVFTTTANGNEELFSFPVPPFDFVGITIDLASIKQLAQDEGIYRGPSPSGNGYHVVVNEDTVDIYDITDLDPVRAYNSEEGSHIEYSLIAEKMPLSTEEEIPDDCGVMFFEDDVWIEGSIQGKTTIAAADLINPNEEANIWIRGDLVYTPSDGTDSADGLLLLAQHNNLITLDSLENMKLQGVFVAQTGRFGRNHYTTSSPTPSWLYDSIKQDTLEMFGTIVSNGRVGTKWSNGSGVFISGYNERKNVYNPEQSINPPPFLPATSPEFQLRNWEEVE